MLPWPDVFIGAVPKGRRVQAARLGTLEELIDILDGDERLAVQTRLDVVREATHELDEPTMRQLPSPRRRRPGAVRSLRDAR